MIPYFGIVMNHIIAQIVTPIPFTQRSLLLRWSDTKRKLYTCFMKLSSSTRANHGSNESDHRVHVVAARYSVQLTNEIILSLNTVKFI
jgi:hypothetical protein